MAERANKEAFVTLATNDTYALGCLVLGNSLRQTQTNRKLVVMITSGVTDSMRNQLSRVFDLLYDVNLLDSEDARNLQLLGRPDLNVTFTKFHCWRLTMFNKAVFLDADTLVLQNVDELFDREELSAAPDAGWPDCFNSGVFVFRPSEETYTALLDYAINKGSFDGGDQGLLNMYFRDWATKDIARHLPFIYNVVSQAFYSYLPALTQFKQDVKIVHFIGATKPWHHPYNTSTRRVQPLPESGHSQEYLQRWWDVFMKNVQPALDPALCLDNGYIQINSEESAEACPVDLQSPMTTIQAVFPYVPPSLDQAQDTNMPQVVEIPVIPRSYTFPESHYSENPMSVINSDFPKQNIYEISKVVKTWADVNVHCNNEELHHASVEKNIENDIKVLSVQQTSSNSQESAACVAVSDMQRLSAPESNTSLSASNSAKDSEGGLIGELASMSIHSEGYGNGSGQNLSDSERKLNWEKGQADYLGADRFENIQKKLEESIQGPATESEGATSSPFQSKSKSAESNDTTTK